MGNDLIYKLDDDSETDDYLIELMGLKDDFPTEALAAYGKIYSRYWNVMFNIAKMVTRDEDIAGDLLADTFNLIYYKASTFRKGKIKNQQNIKLSIQKWMTIIMKHVYYDGFLDSAYKTNSSDQNLEDCFIIETKDISENRKSELDNFNDLLEEIENGDELSSVISDNNDITVSENIIRVKKYIDGLPDRERDIILTYYDQYLPGKYTPTSVLDELEIKWKTTRENIRKILQKFRKSIKADLQTQLFIRK